MSSRFGFLGDTTLGQFIPRDSWFHARDPRARIIAFFMLFSAIIFTTDMWGIALAFLPVVIVFLVAALPIQSTWKGIKRALPFILILAVLQILLSRGMSSETVIGTVFGFEITRDAVLSALMLIFKFIVLIALINAFVMSISTAQVTAALFHLLKPLERLGFPVNDLTMVVQITLRYLPLVAQMAEKTAKAQAARGGDWEQRGFNPVRQAKRVLPLIVPLLVNSLKRAENMALAMESRGFNAGKKRSSFYSMKFNWQDGLLIVVSMMVATIIIVFSRIF